MPLAELAMVGKNSICVDCGAPKPTFANRSIGAFLCSACAVSHTYIFGVANVRCFTLGLWEGEDFIEHLRVTGNHRANLKWEAVSAPYLPRISPTTEPEERDEWIQFKYVAKGFFIGMKGNLQVRCERASPPGKIKPGSRWTKCWGLVKEFTVEFYETYPPKPHNALVEIGLASMNIAPLFDAAGQTVEHLSLNSPHYDYHIKTDSQAELAEWFQALQSAFHRTMKAQLSQSVRDSSMQS